MLVVSRSLFWLVEQPHQSLLVRHYRFELFINRIAFEAWAAHTFASYSARL